MQSSEVLIFLLSIVLFAEGATKIGFLLDENIIKKEKLRKYLDHLDTRIHGIDTIEPVFVSLTAVQQSNVPQKLSEVKCIVSISTENEVASRLGEMLATPVITSSPNIAPVGKFTVSMYPNYELANKVMVDSLKYWEINPVALLYDVKRSEQAAHLQSLARKSNIRMKLMPEMKMDEEKSLTYAAGELKRSHLMAVVLLCDPRKISKVMDQTIEFNLYEKETNKGKKVWRWFALDLDFMPRHECSSALKGFVGFVSHTPGKEENTRIERFKNRVLTTDQRFEHTGLSNNFFANLHDSLYLAVAISERCSHGNGYHSRLQCLHEFRTAKISPCPVGNYSLKKCSLGRKVEFQNGARKVNEIKIVDIEVEHGVAKINNVGEWTPDLRTRSADPSMTWVQNDDRKKCKTEKNPTAGTRKKYKILVKNDDKPFVIINENKSLPMEERFTGFSIDIVRKLASPEYMDFDYTIDILNGTGGVNKNTSRWSGIIGELIDQKADMGTGSLTITAEREKAVDFSKPFMDFTMALILRKPEDEKPNMFRFLDPFSPTVWLCTIMAVFSMTIFMYAVDYLSPYGNRKTAKESDEPGDEFSLYNSLWFATASMLQQGPDNTPKSPSGRLLAASFWFFVLLMISTYTANLAAFFTNKKPKNAISNLEDLSKQNKVKYGVLKGGQIHRFLEQNSNDTVYKKMILHMKKENSFATGADSAVKRARKGGFAYITEEPILEYYNSRSPCDTMLVKHLLEAKSYGFALPKNSELTTNLSVNILDLREKGFMNERYTYWWKTQSQCSTTVKPIGLESMKIQFNSMAGVFIVLVSGVLISLILVVIEVKFKWVIDLILEAGCEQCTDYYCEDDESYEYMETHVETTAPCSIKRVPDAYSNVQESKV
ncbi:glutamate receptor 2-like [Dendronephthya gigantea]|uniref:glutamate receptor 2-like n=1 Tax=Dendronephthya gigantea TaxID=151771 RepID=UPI00106CF677|nr:glutamate receptor 2-like [Dendronephthya gigantea]